MYTSLKIRNYKCFASDHDFQGFDNIKPINVIIGKNNSGKSKLLECIKQLVEKDILNIPFDVCIKRNLQTDELKKSFSDYYNQLGIHNMYQNEANTDWNNVGRHLVGKPIFIKTNAKKIEEINLFELNSTYASKREDIEARIKNTLNLSTLKDYMFIHLQAERDIAKEKINYTKNISNSTIEANATGITEIIARMLTDEAGNKEGWQKFIEKDFLDKINQIVAPEIIFKRIYTKTSQNNLYQIYLEEEKKGGIQLSDCGSGLKTIIATLTLLHIVPYFIKDKKFIFAFEELENNMHPNLERKLLTHLKQYISDNQDNYIFLTTHSNVAIDLFANNKNSQILRVSNDGYKSLVETVSTDDDKRILLNELGVKASDLLQSNCVIWVEGPSDRIYIKKWIELFSSDLKFEEGLHYQFLFYGGALLTHYSMTEHDPFINLLKINKNSYIIMDSDKKTKKAQLKGRVKRIQTELKNKNNYWITKGREIENYLPNNILSLYFDKTINLEQFASFSNIYKKNKQVSDFDKVKFASNITNSELYTLENLKSHLDLKLKMNELIKFIKDSNLKNN